MDWFYTKTCRRSYILKELWELFLVFAKIGGFTFGGGYAMLPIMQRESVERKGWATEDELTDYYAISQCTPGAIAVNTATFVGCKRKGIIGGIVATLGCVFPSVVLITIIAAFLNNFTDLIWVQNILAGIRVCVCVLIFRAVLRLGKKSLDSGFAWGLFAVILLCTLTLDISNVLLVLAAGLAGIIAGTLRERRKV